MIGLCKFCGAILSWAPSLAFTIINEQLGDLRLAMLGIFSFHAIGFLLLTRVDVEKGRESAKLTEHLRFKGGGLSIGGGSPTNLRKVSPRKVGVEFSFGEGIVDEMLDCVSSSPVGTEFGKEETETKETLEEI